ncbi:hypothetical protein VNO80_06567 [Phaseolus coccineus]|uniref:SHSP domain-containing protein n=1 Tax=Phaseolus coccineus TaxID=3886 RepID=A0AAN9NH27_PHACN
MSTYQDLEAKYETEETQESIILRLQLPDGFAREHVGAKVEYGSARVRIHGERSLRNNSMVRFDTFYKVPEYCDMNRIKGKFDGKTVIITIPTIPGKVPKKEPQEPPKEPPQVTEANPDENQDAPTPTDDNQEKTKSTTESKEEVDHETSPPPNASQESMHQKGQEEVQEKAAITEVESKKQVDQETSTPTKDTEESKSQEGQEGIPPKDDSTKVGHDGSTSTPQEHTKESIPQKGEEETPPKATFSTNDKLQGEEKFAEEKQKAIGEEASEDHSKKDLESGKAHEMDGVEDSPIGEIKEERKGLRTFEGDKMHGEVGNDVGHKSDDEKAMPESTKRSRIKEVAVSASQTVTSLAKRFNEEDKQRMIYMGAAVLVVALGVYATYKLRLRRP